ncbi:MAG: J domain-containing protein [bacterium]|nr:J domain-containing protein [bacterium]
MPKDYYKILGLEKNASEEQIKKAFRKLAHEHHPDKVGGNESKFKEINEAYQVLGSKEKRSAYDQFGTADFGADGNPFSGFGGFSSGSGQGPGWDFGNINFNSAGGVDVNDIFEAFFGGGGGRTKRRSYEHGADLEIQETIALEEAFKGVSKKLRYEAVMKCEACGGNGYDVKAGTKTCEACNGRGEVNETRKTFFGNFSQVRTCSECFGTGKKPNQACKECKSSGRIRGMREINYDILPGIADGQIIKITGAGEAGERNTEPGDLYVHVKIKPHPVFERKENDLFMKRELHVVDALLEDAVMFNGIDGKKISVQIPVGFRLRENLKVPHEGMPHFRSYGRGDLYIALDIKMPKKPSAKAKKLLEELRGEL